MSKNLQAFDRILLVPGFMSPGWTFYPLYQWLKNDFPCVEIWDHPRVFDDPHRVAGELADRLRGEDRRTGIVSHSFGDWLVRSAVAAAKAHCVVKIVSICPVASSVPVAKLLHKLSLDFTPELQLMRDSQLASASIDFDHSISHLVLWASLDALVNQPQRWPREQTIHRRLLGTHITLLFQPNVWRIVRNHLAQEE